MCDAVVPRRTKGGEPKGSTREAVAVHLHELELRCKAAILAACLDDLF